MLGSVHLPTHHGVYAGCTPLPPSIPPWVYHHPTLPYYTSTLRYTLPDDEALGSREEKALGERPLLVLKVSKVLKVLYSCAQDCSVSQGEN